MSLKPWAKPSWLQDAAGAEMPYEKFLQLTGAGVTSLTDDPANSRTVADLAAGGGSGNVKLTQCPFAFDTANIVIGADMYTPALDEVLIDMWIEVLTAWDGTTPTAEVGRFLAGYTYGMWNVYATGSSATDLDLSTNAAPDSANHEQMMQLSAMRHYGLTIAEWSVQYTSKLGTSPALINVPGPGFYQDVQPMLPARMLTTDPIKILVNQTGRVGGASSGSTVGSANLYLLTAT